MTCFSRDQLYWLMDRLAFIKAQMEPLILEKSVLEIAAPIIRKKVVEDELVKKFVNRPVIGGHIWITDRLKGIRPARIVSIEFDGYIKVVTYNKRTKRPIARRTIIDAGRIYGVMLRGDLIQEKLL